MLPGDSAALAVVIPEPIEDAFGGVALLPGAPAIIFLDAVDGVGEGLAPELVGGCLLNRQ